MYGHTCDALRCYGCTAMHCAAWRCMRVSSGKEAGSAQWDEPQRSLLQVCTRCKLSRWPTHNTASLHAHAIAYHHQFCTQHRTRTVQLQLAVATAKQRVHCSSDTVHASLHLLTSPATHTSLHFCNCITSNHRIPPHTTCPPAPA